MRQIELEANETTLQALIVNCGGQAKWWHRLDWPIDQMIQALIFELAFSEMIPVMIGPLAWHVELRDHELTQKLIS